MEKMDERKIVARGTFPSGKEAYGNHRSVVDEKNLDETITQIQIMRCVRRILKMVNKNKS
jgi:hypothetical protein